MNGSVSRDAAAQAGSVYRMNCPNAVGYGFTIHKDGKQVGMGEFVHTSEIPDDPTEKWDGFILFRNSKL